MKQTWLEKLLDLANAFTKMGLICWIQVHLFKAANGKCQQLSPQTAQTHMHEKQKKKQSDSSVKGRRKEKCLWCTQSHFVRMFIMYYTPLKRVALWIWSKENDVSLMMVTFTFKEKQPATESCSLCKPCSPLRITAVIKLIKNNI